MSTHPHPEMTGPGDEGQPAEVAADSVAEPSEFVAMIAVKLFGFPGVPPETEIVTEEYHLPTLPTTVGQRLTVNFHTGEHPSVLEVRVTDLLGPAVGGPNNYVICGRCAAGENSPHIYPEKLPSSWRLGNRHKDIGRGGAGDNRRKNLLVLP